MSEQLSYIQSLLSRAHHGDHNALEALIRHSCDRLTALTRRMLGDFERARRWVETDDVLQNALVRLLRAMRDVKPESARDFLALAALQIRRELIDLARHYFGPEGIGANQDSVPSRDGIVEGDEPSLLAQWSELHEQIGNLVVENREVVELLFYQGLTQADAAEVLGVSVRTVQRRWHAALIELHDLWGGELPLC